MLFVQYNHTWDNHNKFLFIKFNSMYYDAFKNNTALTTFRLILVKE